MDSKMSRNKIIEYVFAIIAILIVLLIGPFRMLRIIQVEKSDETIVSESDPISVEYNMTQMFEGVGGELKSVDLYISNDMADQIMTFRLYDENHEQIYEQFVSVPNSFVAPDFLNIPVRFDIEGGKEYSFIVEGLTQDLYLAYEDRATSTSPANIMMAYGGAEVPEYSLVVRYNYACSFTWW